MGITGRESTGMETNKLNNLSELLQREVDQEKINGASILVLHNNQVEFRGNYGFADKEGNIPIKENTIYRIFSMTKPIVAVAAIQLFERGKLDLFAPLSDYLPSFKKMAVATEEGIVDAKSEITIYQIMNMTSGVVYPDANSQVGRFMDKKIRGMFGQLAQGKTMSSVEMCSQMAEVPLAFQPGEGWSYGLSADILGAVMEVITGKKLGQLLMEEIFIPLGMVDTSFFVPQEKEWRLSKIYSKDHSTNQLVQMPQDALLGIGFCDYKEEPPYESGGGGLYSTVEDYGKFASMLLNGGTMNGVRILGSRTLKFMTENKLNEIQAKDFNWESTKGYGYSMLMRTLLDKGAAGSNGSLGEFGWDGIGGTYFLVDPLENLVVVYMQQNIEGGDLSIRRKFRSIIYGALK